MECPCGFVACTACVQRWLLDSSQEQHCMQCKLVWTRKFMFENLNRKFVKSTYKKHREEQLLEKEISLLPATQLVVERQLRVEILEGELNTYMAECRARVNDLQRKITALKTGVVVDANAPVKFVRQCPGVECRGFLSASLKCELCGARACGECREKKASDDHVCNPDVLLNVQSMAKDTKSCPKCSASIFKTDGCDQMYCTACHTAFSWRTLRIETGLIHNPHYFAHLRAAAGGQVPRNPDDVLCGREVDAVFYNRPAVQLWPENMRIVVQGIIETRAYYPMFFGRDAVAESNEGLRVSYLRNRISRDQLKDMVQKKDKANKKNTELRDISRGYVLCMTDVLFRMAAEHRPNKATFDMYSTEMSEVKKCTNDAFLDVMNCYNGTVFWVIGNRWSLTSARKKSVKGVESSRPPGRRLARSRT